MIKKRNSEEKLNKPIGGVLEIINQEQDSIEGPNPQKEGNSNANQEELILSYADFDIGEIYYTGILPEELQLEMVREDKESIMYIYNPTKRVLEEVYGDEADLRIDETENMYNSIPAKYSHLALCTEEEQLEAVTRDGYLIKYIENPSEQVQLAALETYGFISKKIKNPTEKVQETALYMSVDSLEYLRFVTPIEKAHKIFSRILSNPRIKKSYVIDFLDCEFIEGDKLEFINRFGSKKSKKIAMEYELNEHIY